MSHELSCVILPHDHYGSLLDDQRRTIDTDLELRNFQYAGEVLADVWSPLVVDGHPTVAEYIQPHQSKLPVAEIFTKQQSWMDRHVRTSQYFILKLSSALIWNVAHHLGVLISRSWILSFSQRRYW
jgi:hypothetical protein